jgi:hypothetical protein
MDKNKLNQYKVSMDIQQRMLWGNNEEELYVDEQNDDEK